MNFDNAYLQTEKVRFQHVDYAGIVFYPRFLEMLNSLVEDWFEDSLGLPFREMHQTRGIPTVDLKIQFRKAARLGEELRKYLWVKNLGTSSVLLGFRFLDASDSLILEGEVLLVHVLISEKRNDIKSEPFPTEIRLKMERFLIPTSVSETDA
jgi:4-hydroxybenzoyl-CoA thioesterase